MNYDLFDTEMIIVIIMLTFLCVMSILADDSDEQ